MSCALIATENCTLAALTSPMPRLTTADKRASDKLRELERCQRSLWYLATEYLGYEWSPKANRGLTERIHYPICRWIDKHGDDSYLGLWMARSRHKTTVIISRLIQNILKDPCRSHRYWHAVDSLAAEVLLEVGNHLRNNDKLRSLDPVGVDESGKRYAVFPRKNATRWLKTAIGESSLMVNRHKKYGAGTRSPTLKAQGAGSEATGAHIDGEAWLDDIISRKTIEKSEIMKIQRWVQNTVFPIVDAGENGVKLIRGVGTPWGEQTIHQIWMEDPDWRTLIVPGALSVSDEEYRTRVLSGEMKCHFAPDYKFFNPTFGPAEYRSKAVKMLKVEQRQMKGDFSPQIMLDPEPEAERPWSKACENFTGLAKTDTAPGVDGPGQVFVISDPAPFLEGGYRGLGEKSRGDGTKDWWSLCVVKLRVRGDVMDIILMDGYRSQEWGHKDGARAAARLMKRYQTNKFFSENQKEHFQHMLSACLHEGTSLCRARDGGPLKFADYNKADGKNSRINTLADRAKNQEFWICRDTCPDEFLFGDGEHTGFLTQVRKFRKVAPNKTNLRYDDDADVVARATDAALLEFAPSPQVIRTLQPTSPFRPPDDEGPYSWGTRHVRA